MILADNSSLSSFPFSSPSHPTQANFQHAISSLFRPIPPIFLLIETDPEKCSRDKCKLAVVFLIILSFFSFPFFPPFLLIVSQSLTTFLRGTFLFRG